ncbi:WD repeat protein [Grosmannia clavigera kw1407]|uniref:WD repeat protein n=1 Tax=Grosmannia clavigera (strain kw1407 / UAMH 11150) TaxID=655863 RepID=F0X7X3_GROCL|nr:WD repeat protein [Grosmannia clavigera kw1407]EFX06570.1 WD repeat protein [Grosmannia clavigera kw1407]
MKAVLPGKPEPRLQALATGFWESRRVIKIYITGNALAILGSHDTLHQTIYDDDETPLEAVAFDEVSGNIATCTDCIVRVYRPIGRLEGSLQWALQSAFAPNVRASDDADGRLPMTLSWGASQELVVGQAALALYCTGSRPSSSSGGPVAAVSPPCSWHKQLANPVKWASCSYDSAYIACAGYTDRLVKVWRRLSFDSDNPRFDYAYLPHPQPVTGLQWRIPYHVGHTVDHILYTFCADNILRIWTSSEVSGSAHQQLSLWGTVDLAAALGSEPALRPIVWAFVIQGRDLSAATEKAVQERDERDIKTDRALGHLVAIANRSSEICLVLDAQGTLSALSLENLDSKVQKTNDVYNITQLVSPSLDFSPNLGLSAPSPLSTATTTVTAATAASPPTHVEIYTFCNSGGHLHILIHYMAGKIEVYEADIAYLLDDTSTKPRLWRKAIWTGHSGAISKMVRNFSGSAVVSRTDGGDGMVWHHTHGSKDTPLYPQSMLLSADGPILRICVLRKGRFVVFLTGNSITAWDCRRPAPILLGRCAYAISGKPLCLLVLPREHVEDVLVAHIATVTSEKHGIVWEVSLPEYTADQQKANGGSGAHGGPSVEEFCRFDLGESGDLAYVLPVDPAGSNPLISGFLDVFARDVAILYTKSGGVEFWTARIDCQQRRVEWLLTSSMETGVQEPALVSGSTRKKAALVNARRSAVTIWDIRSAQLEYDGSFEKHDTVQDLDWTSTPDSQLILAVGFPHRVLLLSQLRFDYLNKGPAWAAVREISTREHTPHPIGDSTWLGDGDLVIGTGNQLLVHDRLYSVPSSLATSMRLPHTTKGHTWDLFDVVQRLNGPLPVFHPQFLSQCMLAGKSILMQQILLALHKMLKFYIAGDDVDDYLSLDVTEFYMRKKLPESHAADRNAATSFFSRQDVPDEDDEVFTEEVAAAISEKLTSVALPQLSGHEQIQLVDIVECVGLVEKQRRSMDENAARYMLFFRQHVLRKGRTNEIHMSWREINWAYHSTSQDILVDFVSRQHHGSVLWSDARESGMFMWLADNAAVKAQFELVARNEYAKSEVKNPVDCSLFYLALRKKTVLQGLWRMATWNREQGSTLRLLANSFDEPRWRTAALKNAYALMSKRRFEYAVAFFLLADRLQDAVAVCFNQLQDLQLAIAIARVYEGDHGPILSKFLEDEVLPLAAQEGNRWLASWAFWMLHRRDMSVRALITPVYTLIETPCSPDLKSKLFLTDDPALVILYAQLRQKTLQTLRGASKVTPKVEWDLVLHSARLYDRMGCDLLGLDLVRNWEFLSPAPSEALGLGGDINPLKMLGRRSSLVVADLPMSPITGGLHSDVKTGGRAAPTVFEEPDANSLLDSFGF